MCHPMQSIIFDLRHYGAETLTWRSVLSQCLAIIRPDPLDKEIEDLENLILTTTEQIADPKSTKVTVNHAYVSSYVGDTRKECASLDVTVRQVLDQSFASWATDYKQLTPLQKLKFTRIGSIMGIEKNQELVKTREHLTEVLKALIDKRKERQQLPGVRVQVSSVRFSTEEFDMLAEMWNSNAYSLQATGEATAQLPPAPEAPTQAQQEHFNTKSEFLQEPTIEGPWWRSVVVHNRHRFHNCCIANHKGDGHYVYYFLYALQSPQMSCFLACGRRDVRAPYAHSDTFIFLCFFCRLAFVQRSQYQHFF